MGAFRSPEEIVNEILDLRGVTDVGEFLSNKPKLIHDPFLLPDMEEGIAAIRRHIECGSSICIYGDYDVDGIMSVTLMTEFLESIPGMSGRVFHYIPLRAEEGYGLNTPAVKKLARDKIDLLITVDCGSVSQNEVNLAKTLGMDVVVTDHHECDSVKQPDCPVIDPKRADSLYPFAGLSGCGVALKVAQALKDRYYDNDKNVVRTLNDTLDLVAIATVADVMPLNDENRTIVKYGLKLLNEGRRWQLRKLSKGVGLTLGSISSHDIAFVIAPHLNAAGRMGDASRAVELLRADDEASAEDIVSELRELNIMRRAEQEEAYEESVSIVNEKYSDAFFLLIKPGRAHDGVAGIVSGKLRETYGKPAAILTRIDGVPGADANGDSTDPNTDPHIGTGGENQLLLRGSARGIEGIDLISLLRDRSELFLKLGGHAMAAGFMINAGDEEILRKALDEDVRKIAEKNPDIFEQKISSDLDIVSEEATLALAYMLGAFEPTGAGNRKPILSITTSGAVRPRRLGADGRHLKFYAGSLECVMFARQGESVEIPRGASSLKVFGYLDVNSWNGRESVQMIVKSIE